MREENNEVQRAFLLSEVASGRHSPYRKGQAARAIPPLGELKKYEREKQKRFEKFKKDWDLNKRNEELRKSAEIQEKHALLKQLWTDLLRGRTQPRPVIHRQLSAEELWIQRIKEYFHLLRRRVSPNEFNEWVDHFAFAQCDSFTDGSTHLLEPQYVPDMPDLSIFTPRTGGHPPSPDLRVAEREEIIRRYKRMNKSNLEICGALDAVGLPVPTRWREQNRGKPTRWVYYYSHHPDKKYSQRISRIFSEIAPKACHATRLFDFA